MKKMLIAVMIIAMMMTVAACGSGDKEKEGKVADFVKVGETIETTKTSEKDGKEYKTTYKITKIEKNVNEVSREIEEFNTSGRGESIGTLSNDNLEYVVAYYEVFYPKDFPQDGEYGITDVTLDFSITNMEGEDDITVGDTNYKGLNKTWQIGYAPRGYDFYSGDTYEGKILFVMVKDYDGYLIKEQGGATKGI